MSFLAHYACFSEKALQKRWNTISTMSLQFYTALLKLSLEHPLHAQARATLEASCATKVVA